MTTIPETTRRRVLTALGLGTVGSVAGCISAPTNTGTEEPTATRTPTQPNMNTVATTDVDRIAADPTDIPGPIDRDGPAELSVELTTRELVAEVEPGVTYTYMTFDGQIPGPMLRARVGDRVTVSVTNHESNSMPHNVDLHAVRGPGGGAEASLVAPGETKSFRFTATYPGLFIYHCAVPNLDYHISSGMFGAILIEPEDGLPSVDHEFYLGQHELYTTGNPGDEGHHDFDFGGMQRENPTYVLMNGEKYAIGPDGYNELQMQRGESVRIYFAVGGPNLTSSFHPIGSVWDEVWPQGAIESDPHRNVQTTPVLPGSTCIATLHTPVPGPVKLVDHALSRVARKGCMAIIDVEGEPNPDIFDPMETASGPPASDDDFDGWFDNVDNFDGVVDRTGESEIVVEVGSQANGGPYGFDPAAVQVSPGTTVTWEWVADMHNVVAQDGSFESQLTDEVGHTFSHRFDTTRTHKYVCVPHEAMGMKGAVVVE